MGAGHVDASNGLWGAVVALIGLISLFVTGRRGPRELPPPPPGQQEVATEQLQVSPQIWGALNNRIGELERKVDHMTEVLEEGQQRESRLRELLRMALKVVRRANKRLHAAGLPEEPVPAELIPYSID